MRPAEFVFIFSVCLPAIPLGSVVTSVAELKTGGSPAGLTERRVSAAFGSYDTSVLRESCCLNMMEGLTP